MSPSRAVRAGGAGLIAAAIVCCLAAGAAVAAGAAGASVVTTAPSDSEKSASDDEKSVSRDDAREGVALDLVQAGVAQKLQELTLRVRFAGDAADALAAAGDGSTVCFEFSRDGRDTALCAVAETGRLRVTRDGRTIDTEAKTSGDELIVRGSGSELGLDPGVYQWSVVASAAACDAVASPVPCVDRAPEAGAYNVRVWRVAPSGCKAKGPLEVRRGPRVKKVALTFDDGPSSYTPSLLRTLKQRRVHATFFVLGSQVNAGRRMLRRQLGAGHALGAHGWSHYPMGGGGPRATNEMRRSQLAVREATGYTPCVFRPPYGDTGPNLRSRARALGMTTVIWSVDPRDWATPGTGAIVGNALANTGPGGIVLMHDGGGNRSQTLAAVPQIVTGLRRRGYKFVTLPELMRYKQRYALVR